MWSPVVALSSLSIKGFSGVTGSRPFFTSNKGFGCSHPVAVVLSSLPIKSFDVVTGGGSLFISSSSRSLPSDVHASSGSHKCRMHLLCLLPIK